MSIALGVAVVVALLWGVGAYIEQHQKHQAQLIALNNATSEPVSNLLREVFLIRNRVDGLEARLLKQLGRGDADDSSTLLAELQAKCARIERRSNDLEERLRVATAADSKCNESLAAVLSELIDRVEQVEGDVQTLEQEPLTNAPLASRIEELEAWASEGFDRNPKLEDVWEAINLLRDRVRELEDRRD